MAISFALSDCRFGRTPKFIFFGVLLEALLAWGACPVVDSSDDLCLLAPRAPWSLDAGERQRAHQWRHRHHPGSRSVRLQDYGAAVAELDFDLVKADIQALLTDSQPFWPADFGNYGPFFVRLAWHCSGSYRLSDGRGGCEGGRLRFDPERSWEDNTNLDKALALLAPIKLKYGLGLSWGDLIVLAGTTAIEAMGGPVLGFCGGRVDDENGDESLPLGPSPVQERLYPCLVNGTCKWPLGTTTVGLIYVNPEGPMGEPDTRKSATEIRDVFGRMGMNDSETVALIGGGHAFGKAHGPCPAGAGPSPKEDPFHPWPGKCGAGKGNDTYTSGFEFQWTDTPTQWSNKYFKALTGGRWEKSKGPGGKWQWRSGRSGPNMGMLTSDVALLHDSEHKYQEFLHRWSQDQKSLDEAFAHAWYKLVTRDMGPVTRCVGKNVPPPQPFQHPLPQTNGGLPDFDEVAERIRNVINTSDNVSLSANHKINQPSCVASLVRLAWRCADTYRETDHTGGCNGARLRLSPQKDWPINADLDKTLLLLQPIKESFGDALSWADLIVLAGSVAIEEAGGLRVPFCGGRTDAHDGTASPHESERISADLSCPIVLMDELRIKGWSVREFVALLGGGHSLGQMHVKRSGYTGSWTSDPARISNEYFKVLLTENWTEFTVPESGKKQFKATGNELYMLSLDMLVRVDPELAAVAQEYASDNDLFLREFASSWAKFMNADRFDGPTGNLCSRPHFESHRVSSSALRGHGV